MSGLTTQGLILPVAAAVLSFTIDGYVAYASHDGPAAAAIHDLSGQGHEIPGLSFRVFIDRGTKEAVSGLLEPTQADAALQTVIETFSYLNQHRHSYPRFDEAVSKWMLDRVIIQPNVQNHEGKVFPFLVVRTVDPGRVRLLISAASMKEQGYLGAVEQFAPVLAREFEWVVSKAETGQKPKTGSRERDLRHAPIRTDKEIRALSGEERVRLLQQLFETYLHTVDDQQSLDGQSYYEIGNTILIPPSQPDSATKFYDIRVREALQQIVREPSFLDRMPLAVTNLLNGTIWNVTFVKVDQRDWATRTRVQSADKAVMVGVTGRSVQPAAILINLHRTAAPADPFYADTKDLPMGALSGFQLALVIAKEIQQNIIEKSQTGHVAQDALTAPQ
ncbi:MAG: hypothetical protein CV088_04740 [Nitrospira sp. LK70]|nr:hypothetical protein [Nitrospira sp. LK70]